MKPMAEYENAGDYVRAAVDMCVELAARSGATLTFDHQVRLAEEALAKYRSWEEDRREQLELLEDIRVRREDRERLSLAGFRSEMEKGAGPPLYYKGVRMIPDSELPPEARSWPPALDSALHLQRHINVMNTLASIGVLNMPAMRKETKRLLDLDEFEFPWETEARLHAIRAADQAVRFIVRKTGCDRNDARAALARAKEDFSPFDEAEAGREFPSLVAERAIRIVRDARSREKDAVPFTGRRRDFGPLNGYEYTR